MLRFTLTKNLRKGPPRSVALIKFAHSDVFPVAWIQYYITVCQCLKVPLDQGYFFRTAERSGSIGSKPFTGSAMNNRLRKHLSEAKLYAEETPHSFRVGLSNTLRLLGCSLEDVAHYSLPGLEKWGDPQAVYAGLGRYCIYYTSRKGFTAGTIWDSYPGFTNPDNLQASV